MGEINVVPYIDVMLVLLIIFMITAPLLTQGVKVELPKAGAEPIPPQNIQPLVLSVDRAGRLYLNVGGNPQTAIDEATVEAADLLSGWPEEPWTPGFAEGAAVQAVCDAIETSAEASRWVSIGEVLASGL